MASEDFEPKSLALSAGSSSSVSPTADADLRAYIDELRNQFSPRRSLILINGPTFSFKAFNLDTAKNQGYYVYPPTGLQCLRAALKDLGIDVEIIDLNFLMLSELSHWPDGKPAPNLDDLLLSLLGNALSPWDGLPDGPIVGVSASVTVSNIFQIENHPFVQILEYLRERHQFITLAGGVIATNECKNLLIRNLAHFVVTGEGENKLCYLLRLLFDDGHAKAINGIFYQINRKIRESAGEKDAVSFCWDLVETYRDIPVEQYYQAGSLSPFSRMAGPKRRFATVQLVRGCRGNCTFCGVTPFMGRGPRAYSVDQVIGELKYLVHERGIQHVEFLDDDFLGRIHEAQDLLQRMIDEKLSITWAANNGLVAASLTPEVLRLISDSGCVGFRIGVESGNDEMLRQIRKPVTKPKLRKASQLLQSFPELFVVGCYIIGFKGETYQQILDTFHFCLDLDLSWAGFSVFQDMRDENVSTEFDTSVNDEQKAAKKVIDFVPTKAYEKGVLSGEEQIPDIHRIFARPRSELHNPAYLNEIWFACNFLANYVCNKYLRPGSNPSPFLHWTSALILSHPANPIIRLFHALAYVVDNQPARAQVYRTQAAELVAQSPYWQKRFADYLLAPVLADLPKDALELDRSLENIRQAYSDIIQH